MMTAIRDLARELRLSVPSVTYHCRMRGIEYVRRLPEGADGGQCIAFVVDSDAQAIRQHYQHRIASRDG